MSGLKESTCCKLIDWDLHSDTTRTPEEFLSFFLERVFPNAKLTKTVVKLFFPVLFCAFALTVS